VYSGEDGASLSSIRLTIKLRALDWNSYTQSFYQSLQEENPNGAVGIGSGLSYNPCTDDFNCQ